MSLRQNVDSHTYANNLAFLETITRMSSRLSDCFSFLFLETRILYVVLDISRQSRETRLALKLQRYACFWL